MSALFCICLLSAVMGARMFLHLLTDMSMGFVAMNHCDLSSSFGVWSACPALTVDGYLNGFVQFGMSRSLSPCTHL